MSHIYVGENAMGGVMTLTQGVCSLFRRTNFSAIQPSVAHLGTVRLFSGATALRAVEGKDYKTRSFASRKTDSKRHP